MTAHALSHATNADGGEDSSSSRLKPKAALLLIDMQKAFTVGQWASHFGGEQQVTDIARACEEAGKLLESGRLPASTPILSTKCYLAGSLEEPFVDILEPWLKDQPCIHKRTMDVTLNRRYEDWLRKIVEEHGVDVLVIGGCTTTSCVRVSSQRTMEILPRLRLPREVRVVVDLSLCGARSDNYDKTADQDPVLLRAYGLERCMGKSAVDLAILQMRSAGVEVLEDGPYEW
eukprot:TRINITY_DN52047_c0_g1_i1.p1 TRINITY_DN52047_c0_g1~~TRINITY_DN52047_c0_g1_i1.p1  ORF type:complete len:231 (-),score=48.93 TRINITY_DN52047_c0_g1_i1:149-841(-)